MRFIFTILFSAFVFICTIDVFAEADYPSLHNNSGYRQNTSSRVVVLKSDKELEAESMTTYYMSSPSAKPKTSKYSLTGNPAYKDPSILRKNREGGISSTNRYSLVADPSEMSKQRKSYYKYYKRKRYNYDFLYEEEPVEETSGTLKLTL